MAIHKSVNYCVKQFKHDQDNGEDIGAKFLLCCLDSEFSLLKNDEIFILHLKNQLTYSKVH